MLEKKMNKKPKKTKSEKVQTYLAFYEPMLNLEIRLYMGDEWEFEYWDLLQEVSGRFLDIGEAGNTITQPIEAGDGWYFRAMRIRDKASIRYLIHEMYHLVNAIRDAYDLGEEWGAYLMGWLAEEIYLHIDE